MNRNSFFVLLLSFICMAFLPACGSKKVSPDTSYRDNAVKIRSSGLTEQVFNWQIHVHGNIRPVDSAVISAKTSGTIESLNVKEGDFVKKGAVLFLVDHENQKNLAEAAEHAVNLMNVASTAAELDFQMADTNWKKAEQDYQRSKSLVEVSAVSKSSFEMAETNWKNAKFQLDKAKTGVDSAALKVREAILAKTIADKALADSEVKAPYDAIVTARKKYSGEFVGAGTPVLMIESQQEQEISAYISAIYYNVINEKTPLILSFGGMELCRTTVSYISPSVDALTRTFEIKAKLPQKGNLINGTLCDITIILDERKGVGIRSDAILPRASGKSVVFVPEGDSAREIEVETGFSTGGVTEILTPEKLDGKRVIVSGQYYLSDGSQIINMDNK